MLTRLPKRRCEISRENPFFGSGVRQARRRFQARIWLGDSGGGTVNLGLYETPVTAKSVLREVCRRASADAWTPLEIWRTTVLAADRFSGDAASVMRGLLPKWVHVSFDDKTLMAKVRSKDRLYVRGGFQCPETAHRDALRVWEQIYGPLAMPGWRRKDVVEVSGQ